MNSHRRRGGSGAGIPTWVTVVVVLAILVYLGYTIAAFGPDGYPIDMMLGGVLGAYAGVDQLLKRGGRGGDDEPSDGAA